jgi:hypothetical protein
MDIETFFTRNVTAQAATKKGRLFLPIPGHMILTKISVEVGCQLSLLKAWDAIIRLFGRGDSGGAK